MPPTQKQSPTGFNLFTEIIGWLQVFLSPFLCGAAIGCIIYFSGPGTLRLVLALLVAVIGLITGIVWATRVWKKKGTMHFMSRIMASPEFDDIKKQEPGDSSTEQA